MPRSLFFTRCMAPALAILLLYANAFGQFSVGSKEGDQRRALALTKAFSSATMALHLASYVQLRSLIRALDTGNTPTEQMRDSNRLVRGSLIQCDKDLAVLKESFAGVAPAEKMVGDFEALSASLQRLSTVVDLRLEGRAELMPEVYQALDLTKKVILRIRPEFAAIFPKLD